MQQNNQLFPNALFNVPAGKTIKKRVPCVCLEFGKPDPKPQLKYQLTPIDTVVHSAKVMRLLEKLGDGETNQTHVQLAVWNAQNPKTPKPQNPKTPIPLH